jgi:hypothetical protein
VFRVSFKVPYYDESCYFFGCRYVCGGIGYVILFSVSSIKTICACSIVFSPLNLSSCSNYWSSVHSYYRSYYHPYSPAHFHSPYSNWTPNYHQISLSPTSNSSSVYYHNPSPHSSSSLTPKFLLCFLFTFVVYGTLGVM